MLLWRIYTDLTVTYGNIIKILALNINYLYLYTVIYGDLVPFYRQLGTFTTH